MRALPPSPQQAEVDLLQPLGHRLAAALTGGADHLGRQPFAQRAVLQQPGGGRGCQRGLIRRVAQSRAVARRRDDHASGGSRLPGQPRIAVHGRDQDVRPRQQRCPRMFILRAERADAAAGGGGDVRAQRPPRPPVPDKRQLQPWVLGDQPDQRLRHTPAVGRPLCDHLRAVPGAGLEQLRDRVGQQLVVPRIQRLGQLRRARAGRQQGVDASPVALATSSADRVGDGPFQLGVERRNRQATGVGERRGGQARHQRLVGVDDVEAALAHRQRDVGRGAHRQSRAPCPAPLAVRHGRPHGNRQRLARQRLHRRPVSAGQRPQPLAAAAQRPRRRAGREHRHPVPASGQGRGLVSNRLRHRMRRGQRIRTDEADVELGAAYFEAFSLVSAFCFLAGLP